MEIQDGFIVGIFNYCDRWCGRCGLTSYCLVFANAARHTAAGDPGFRELTEASEAAATRPVPPWMREMIEELNEAAARAADIEEEAEVDPPVSAEHLEILARADDYLAAVHRWLGKKGPIPVSGGSDPRSAIAWHHTQIAAKVHRALDGPLGHDGSCDVACDHEGSAKAALAAIGDSRAAWVEAAAQGMATRGDAVSFIEQLDCLEARIDRALPRARAFIRPGLDEPEALARLRAGLEPV